MEITAYTTKGCKYCSTLEQLFDRAKTPYKKVLVGDDRGCDLTMFEFTGHHPNVKGFPYVTIDGKVIGSLVETAKYFMDKGLVSAPKR